MDSYSVAELQRLRSHPQSMRPKLAVYIPATTFSGMLASSHIKGAISLTVSTLSGSLAAVRAGQTLVIGDPGNVNSQRIRVRSTSGSNVINVAENSIDWPAFSTEILRILLIWEPWIVTNRIVNDGNNVTFYEDYDQLYDGSNSTFDPVINIGPAAFALEKNCDASGTFAALELNANESFCFDSSVSNYSWGILYGDQDAWDAEIIGSSSGTICDFRFYETGSYYIFCTGTAANGKSRTAYRPIVVSCNKPGQAGSPIENFEVKALEGSREQAYWRCQLNIFEDISYPEFPRNTWIILYTDVAYGVGASRSTEQVPWHYTGEAAKQRFVGLVQSVTLATDYRGKGAAVSIVAAGLGGILSEKSAYPMWLKYESSPAAWTQLAGLTVDRAVHFMLNKRSTLLNITDWHPTNDSRLMQYADIPAGQLFLSIREFLYGTIGGEIVTDRHSCIWTELDAQLVSDNSRSAIAVTVHELTNQDRMNTLTSPIAPDKNAVSWMSLEGLYFNGSTNVPRISWAPGYVLSYKGGSQKTRNGYVLPATQAEFNEFVGRVYSSDNNPYADISWESQGVYNYDIAPQGILSWSELASGTFREETIENCDLLIRTVSDRINNANASLICEVTAEVVIKDWNASVFPGVPKAILAVEGLFPPEATGIDPDDFSVNWPKFDFSWPAFSISFPARANPATVLATQSLPFTQAPACYALTNGGIYRTRGQTLGSPVWEQVVATASLPIVPNYPIVVGDGFDMVLDPWNPKMACYVCARGSNFGVNGIIYVWYIENLDGVPGTQTITRICELVQGDPTVVGAVSNIVASINIEGAVFLNSVLGGFVTWNHYSIRRLGYGQSFTALFINQSAENSPGVITLGHHATSPSVGKVYVGHDAMYRSTNFGSSYASLVATITRDIHVPYNDNPNDEIVYIGNPDINQTYAIQRRNADGSVSYIAPFISSLGRYAAIDDYLQIHTFTNDRLALSVNVEGRYLFVSTNGGDTWTQRNDAGADYDVRIGGWPYNKNILFWFGNSSLIFWTANAFGSEAIVWNEITGNLPTLTGSARVLRFVPVWVP